MKFNIPKDVEYITSKLEDRGFEAFIVGGCVRDSLLNRVPKDWDIATNATPSEVKDVFSGDCVIPTGEVYGTVTIMIDNEGYEITTYRNDGNYSDGRRPDKVVFSNSIIEDLSRRDFTINSMAYSHKTGLIDPFQGKTDINNKIIRCVGNPYMRFNEDALRIMRMYRFSARYKFYIEGMTLTAAKSLIKTLDYVSEERINKELHEIVYNLGNVKIEDITPLLLQVIHELKPSVGCVQNNPYHYLPVYDHIIESCVSCRPNANFESKMALLLHDIGKPYCYTEDENGVGHFYGHGDISSVMALRILKRLKFSNKEIDMIISLIAYHDRPIEPTKKSIKRALSKMGNEIFENLIDVKEGDYLAQVSPEDRLKSLGAIRELYKEIQDQKECFSIKDLCISGNDIMNELGIGAGKDVGRYLKLALEFVTEDNSRNNKEIIINYLKSLSR